MAGAKGSHSVSIRSLLALSCTAVINVFFAASGELNIGMEGPGANSINSDPLLLNYIGAQGPEDFKLTASSPAVNSGLDLGYNLDFRKL